MSGSCATDLESLGGALIVTVGASEISQGALAFIHAYLDKYFVQSFVMIFSM